VIEALGRVGGVVAGVPDPDAAARFLRDALGFETRPLPDASWSIVCDGDYGPHGQAAIELRAAERTSLQELVLEVAQGYDLEALLQRAVAGGAKGLDGDGAGIVFVDPSGITVRAVPSDARQTEMPEPHPLRPRRLGHVNLTTPEPTATAAFWQDVLGLALSEQIGDRLFFLRIGSEHHNVGLRPGGVGGLHHLGFEIGGWQHYQPILDRIAALGHRVEYGPGRHTPGNNIFTYLLEPSSGLRLELFADMAQIPDPAAYEPKRWRLEDRFSQTLNRWGPQPPESFLA
jgi:catechol 2,3-dioxygenase-like lactoylglutathione lyase family enzyme